jgi:hypothetical protein
MINDETRHAINNIMLNATNLSDKMDEFCDALEAEANEVQP